MFSCWRASAKIGLATVAMLTGHFTRRAAASENDLHREIAALRLTVAALTHENHILRRRKGRIAFTRLDKFLLGWFSEHLPGWKELLVTAKPATIRRWWHRRRRIFWRDKSKAKGTGRPPIARETITFIKRMAKDNPTWGAPRIRDELRMLGIDVALSTVQKYMPRRPSRPEDRQRWLTFLRNHMDETVAMDFLHIRLADFKDLVVLAFIHLGTRKIIHFNVTDHPTAAWLRRQLFEAFPGDETMPRYLISDRDAIFSSEIKRTLKTVLGIEYKQTAARSPWQNGYIERFFGTCRRELLNHMLIFGERQARKRLAEFLAYYHDDRTHLGLHGETPSGRSITPKPSPAAKLVALPRLGGLHHRYVWRDAA